MFKDSKTGSIVVIDINENNKSNIVLSKENLKVSFIKQLFESSNEKEYDKFLAKRNG